MRLMVARVSTLHDYLDNFSVASSLKHKRYLGKENQCTHLERDMKVCGPLGITKKFKTHAEVYINDIVPNCNLTR